MSNYVIKIITDLSKFQERVDEITSSNSFDTIKHVVAELKRTLVANKDLVALCAPQIGYNLRIFCVKSSGDKVKAFLNPMIVSTEKEIHLSRETNASFPNKQFIIPRKDAIHLAYQEVDGRVNSETYKGVYAEVVQQMVEMLDGILLSDYGLDLDDVGGPDKFDKATKKDKETLIKMYLDSLKVNSNTLNTEINNDESLQSISKTIDFITDYIKGDIKPVDKDNNIVEPKKEDKEE